jgi:ribonuclease III
VANPEELQSIINIEFKNKDLLRQAFVHSSYLNENPELALTDNERLEFLGDAVLNLVVAETIFNRFPSLSEGRLTEIRVSLIREETLAQLAAGLELGEYLSLAKGEENSGGRNKQSNLADTFEALIGAIFLDFDLEAARSFIAPRIEHYLSDLSPVPTAKNYKGHLQEYFQTEYKQLPLYRLVDTSGPDHDRNFIVEVVLDGKVLGRGDGKNKKAAEMNAARTACDQLGIKV